MWAPWTVRFPPPQVFRVMTAGRSAWRGEPPQPLMVVTDVPPRFIRDDRTAGHHRAQGVVGWLGLTGGAVDRVDPAAARDREPEAVVEQLGDPAEREATLFY